jgi:hypothetical protein
MAALRLGGSFVTCGYCRAVPRPLSASIVAGRRAGLVSRGRIIAHLDIPASEGSGLRLDLCSAPSQRSLDGLRHIVWFR